MYTYCNTAYEHGTPAVRAMVLEYPDDPVTRDKTTQYQFMSGEWMLVAPVYESSYERDSIYFPEGKFVDYWDGTVYEGPQFVNDYPAPLDKCPVFIRSGAIIPMYTERLYDSQYPKDTITYDVYPNGYSSFELYEDDGVTREYRDGAFAKTLIECDGPIFGTGGITTINVGESDGDYEGKPAERINLFELHIHQYPQAVLLDEQPLDEYASLEELEQATDGWYYDPDDRLGIVHVKTQPLPTDDSFEVKIDAFTNTDESKTNNSFTIFPNPSSGMVYIQSTNDDLTEIKVYDYQGKLLKDVKIKSNSTNIYEINLSKYPGGIYFFELKAGAESVFRKITKL
jgi:hypothetical protein